MLFFFSHESIFSLENAHEVKMAGKHSLHIQIRSKHRDQAEDENNVLHLLMQAVMAPGWFSPPPERLFYEWKVCECLIMQINACSLAAKSQQTIKIFIKDFNMEKRSNT